MISKTCSRSNIFVKITIMQKALLFFICLLLSAPSFALKPSKKYEAIPDTLKLPYEKNVITTSDNVHLKSWTFLPDKEADNHTSVVLAYADAGNMSWWLMQATILSQAGFTVVMFDYRGFGESDAFTIDPKMLYYNEFATDLSAAIQFAKTKYPKNKTGVWCFSMGTIIATLATRNSQPDFIIGDSYVTDPAIIKTYYAKKNDEIKLPADAGGYAQVLNKIDRPMLLFSGTRDKITTNQEAKKMKKLHPAINLVSFDGEHMQGFFKMTKDFPGSEYIKAIQHFLKLE